MLVSGGVIRAAHQVVQRDVKEVGKREASKEAEAQINQ